jgi:hypothetical protein
MSEEVIDIVAGLVKLLPETFTIANGDVIGDDGSGVKAFDAEEDVARPAYPYITVQRLPQPRISQFNEFFEAKVKLVDQTDRLYAGATPGDGAVGEAALGEPVTPEGATPTIYPLSQKDVSSIVAVEASVGGSYVTLASSNYQIVELEGYTTGSAIEFTGAAPDAGTTFTVSYKHKLYQVTNANQVRHTLRLFVWCGPLAPGARGATVFYPKSRLAEQLSQAVLGALARVQGQALDSGNTAKIGAAASIGTIPTDQAESFMRAAIDVLVHQHQRVVILEAEAVGRIVAAPEATV